MGLIGADFSLRAGMLEKHYPHDRGVMTAVCDTDPAKLELYEKEHPGSKAFLCSDYRELVGRDDVDAVFIFVRDRFHEEMAVAALEAENMSTLKNRWLLPSKGATGFLKPP